MSEDGSSKAQLGPFMSPSLFFQNIYLFQKEADFSKGVTFNSGIEYDRHPSSKHECMTAFHLNGKHVSRAQYLITCKHTEKLRCTFILKKQVFYLIHKKR